MITPRQIREKKISTVERDGYDRNEVNELLVDIIESYEAVCEENKELYRKMEILANRIEEYRGILQIRRHLSASPLFKGMSHFR